jgi:chromate transporter
MQKSGFAFDNVIIMLITVLLLFTKKVPAPLIVVFTLLAGFLI